jgi:hypothetical protein
VLDVLVTPDPVLPFLWLYGADAVGKSTVAWEVYEQLTSRGVPMAYVDIDYLAFCRPLIGDSPNRLVELNLGAMWLNFAASGARGLIAAGVMIVEEDRRRYEAAIPGAVLTLCRLRAGPETLRSRIMRRGRIEGADSDGAVSGLTMDRLSEYADQAARFAAKLDADDFADFTVDTDGRTVPEIARLILEQLPGWPALALG